MRKRRNLATLVALVAVLAAACNGQPDPDFGTDGVTTFGIRSHDQINDVAIQADGKIVAVGASSHVWDASADEVFTAVRLNTDGSLDTSFGGGDGKVEIDFTGYADEWATAVVVHADGTILIGGSPEYAPDWLLAKLNPDGSLAAGEGNQGDGTSIWVDDAIDADIELRQVYDMVAMADGRTLLAGGNVVSRFGAGPEALFPDPTFGGRPDGEQGFVRFVPTGGTVGRKVFDVATRANGDLVIAAEQGVWAATATGHLPAEIETLPAPVVYTSVAVQPDGKILTSGGSYAVNPPGFRARLLPDGAPDATFLGTPWGPVPQPGYQVGSAEDFSVQADGKIIAAARGSMTRLNPDGTTDTSFGNNGNAGGGGDGIGAALGGFAVQADGKYVVAGAKAFGLNMENWFGRFTQ